jgi:hypothetical protein
MSQIDYSEILLEAVDTVIGARLANLPYDKTIICIVTDDSQKESGIYSVTDGSITFEAISDKDTYAVDNQVYVSIPQGDMTQKKHITGRYVSDTTTSPVIYVTPLEKVIRITDLFNYSDATGIAANSNAEEGKPTLVQIGEESVGLSINTTINDTLAIRASFKTNFNEAMTSGSYGLMVELYNEEQDSPVAFFLLDSRKDMFGNVYGYTTPLIQQ